MEINHNVEVTTAVSSGYDSLLTNADRQHAVTRSSRNVTSPQGGVTRIRGGGGGGEFRNETTTIPSNSYMNVTTQRTEPNRNNHTNSLNNNRNTASALPNTSLNISNHKLDDDVAKPSSIDGIFNVSNNISGVQNTTQDKGITFDPNIITSRNNTSILQPSSNRASRNNNTQSESSTLKPIINESTISRVEISTSTISSSTTSIPFYYRNNNATNYNSTVLRIPLKIPALIPNNTRYNLEATTRKAWRPVSTMRPMERSTSTTERPTTTPVTTTSTTSLRSVPKTTENRASETTFGVDSQPSAEFTVRPNLGSPRDAPDEDEGPSISVATYALLSLAFVTAIGVASYGARHFANRRRRVSGARFLLFSSTF